MIFGFIVLLRSLARVADLTKCLFLNDKPCIIRPTIIDMNPVELKCYPFMISLKKCTGSCNVLSPKICAPKEIKDINVKGFNMITNKAKMKLKQWQNIFHAILNANSIVQHVTQNKNRIIKHVNVNAKIIVNAKKIIFGILVHVFVGMVSIGKVLLILQWLSVMKL